MMIGQHSAESAGCCFLYERPLKFAVGKALKDWLRVAFTVSAYTVGR